MGRTACTEPQCLYKGALYLFLPHYLFSLHVHCSQAVPTYEKVIVCTNHMGTFQYCICLMHKVGKLKQCHLKDVSLQTLYLGKYVFTLTESKIYISLNLPQNMNQKHIIYGSHI